MWTWDAHIGKCVQCCENQVWNVVKRSDGTCYKWEKYHLSYGRKDCLYSNDLDSSQGWAPIFQFPLSSFLLLTWCSTKMTKKVEKSDFGSTLHWQLCICEGEIRCDLNWSGKNITLLFLCKCATYYYLMLIFFSFGCCDEPRLRSDRPDNLNAIFL